MFFKNNIKYQNLFIKTNDFQSIYQNILIFILCSLFIMPLIVEDSAMYQLEQKETEREIFYKSNSTQQ